MSPIEPKMLSRWLLPQIGIGAWACVTLLYLFHQSAYFAFMRVLIEVPVPHVFADWEWIPNSIECWRKGVDVFVNNTCYYWPNLGFNYSPLWLRLNFIPTGHVAAMATAFVLILCFFLSLALLPRLTTWGELTLMAAALLSSATGLLVERANADLVMFLLIVAGATGATFSIGVRLLGYALICFAGLLKFYPFVGLALAVRERITVLLGVGVATALAFGALVLAFRQDLVTMSHNLPDAFWWTLQFGADELPGGAAVFIALMVGKLQGVTIDVLAHMREGLQLAGKIFLSLGALSSAWFIVRRWALVSVMSNLSERGSIFLIVGGAILCGCFFAGPNVLYRGIYWLLVLPGLLELARIHPNSRTRRLICVACGLAVFVLFMPVLQWSLAVAKLATFPLYVPGDLINGHVEFPFGALLWCLNELCWWLLISVLLATSGTAIYLSSPVFGSGRYVTLLTGTAAVRPRLGSAPQ